MARRPIKDWVVTTINADLLAGRITEADLARSWGDEWPRLERALARRRREEQRSAAAEAGGTARVTIYGRVQRRTERAVLFAQHQDAAGQPHTGESWWPLSQVEVLERALGPLDALVAPAWLVRQRGRH